MQIILGVDVVFLADEGSGPSTVGPPPGFGPRAVQINAGADIRPAGAAKVKVGNGGGLGAVPLPVHLARVVADPVLVRRVTRGEQRADPLLLLATVHSHQMRLGLGTHTLRLCPLEGSRVDRHT